MRELSHHGFLKYFTLDIFQRFSLYLLSISPVGLLLQIRNTYFQAAVSCIHFNAIEINLSKIFHVVFENT